MGQEKNFGNGTNQREIDADVIIAQPVIPPVVDEFIEQWVAIRGTAVVVASSALEKVLESKDYEPTTDTLHYIFDPDVRHYF